MTDQTNEIENESQEAQPNEKQILMDRCRKLGITFSNNATVETLKAKIAEKTEGTKSEPEVQEKAPAVAEVNPLIVDGDESDEEFNARVMQLSPVQRKIAIRKRLEKDALKLIRVRIANLDPKKKDLPGEIITFANKYIGTVKRYIPFGEATDDGFHIEKCLFDILDNRRFLHLSSKKGKNGQPMIQQRYVKEFALEVMPQMTQEELAKLAAAQAAANGAASD